MCCAARRPEYRANMQAVGRRAHISREMTRGVYGKGMTDVELA